MEQSTKIFSMVHRIVPFKTKTYEITSADQVDLGAEFVWQKECIKGKTKRNYTYRAFTWNNPHLTEIVSKGKNLLEKISNAHTVDNMPTQVVVVECIKTTTYKSAEEVSTSKNALQKECQKITLYALTMNQIEVIVTKISTKTKTKGK